MDIPHILYSTIGTDFEKFLAPKDLLTMSKVSKTTREGDITRRFRHLLDVTLKEFEIFKNNNMTEEYQVVKSNDVTGESKTFKKVIVSKVTMDDFLKNIPLGVIYKGATLEPETDFNLLLDHFNCNNETRIAVFIELAPLDKFKEYMDGLYSGKVDSLLYSDYIFQASIRGRDDIVEYLFEDKRIQYSMTDIWKYNYYPGSQRLRDLFVKHETEIIQRIRDEYATQDLAEYGIIGTDWLRVDVLHKTVWLTTCFQEQDMFIQYYLKYRKSIPKYLRTILEDKSLKYNINKDDPKLSAIHGR